MGTRSKAEPMMMVRLSAHLHRSVKRYIRAKARQDGGPPLSITAAVARLIACGLHEADRQGDAEHAS